MPAVEELVVFLRFVVQTVLAAVRGYRRQLTVLRGQTRSRPVLQQLHPEAADWPVRELGGEPMSPRP